MLNRSTVTVTTDGSGNAGFKAGPFNGYLVAIEYTKPGANSYSAGVDFEIRVNNSSGRVLWDQDNVDASARRCPREDIHDETGTAIEGGVAPIPLVGDHVYIAIANGGSAKDGVFEITTCSS